MKTCSLFNLITCCNSLRSWSAFKVTVTLSLAARRCKWSNYQSAARSAKQTEQAGRKRTEHFLGRSWYFKLRFIPLLNETPKLEYFSAQKAVLFCLWCSLTGASAPPALIRHFPRVSVGKIPLNRRRKKTKTLAENSTTTFSHPHACSAPHHTHHSEELAHVEINAVVKGEEAAYHQDKDGEEQREVDDGLPSPVSGGIKPRYLQLRVCFDLQQEKKTQG